MEKDNFEEINLIKLKEIKNIILKDQNIYDDNNYDIPNFIEKSIIKNSNSDNNSSVIFKFNKTHSHEMNILKDDLFFYLFEFKFFKKLKLSNVLILILKKKRKQ
jgi:hypothetical protein